MNLQFIAYHFPSFGRFGMVAKIGWPADIVDLHDVPQPITGIALQGKRLFGSDECFASLCTRHLIEREGFVRVPSPYAEI